MKKSISYVNHFLVAMPGLNQSIFRHSVIYLCEHRMEGAIGMIINQPMPMPMSMKLMFDQLSISERVPEMNEKPLLFGGPIQPERGFVIHRPMSRLFHSSLVMSSEVTLTTSSDIITAIAQNQGPNNPVVTLGYSAWNRDQLEKELADNAWLICPFSSELLFEVPFEQRWYYAGKTLGINMNDISLQSGHG